MSIGSIRAKAARGTFIALFFCVALQAGAEDHWSFTLGGGAYVSNVYVGADEYFLAALPVARAVYKKEELEFSASILDGIALQYLDMDRHFLASVGVNLGEKRDSEEYMAGLLRVEHSGRTKRLLSGSPTASNPVYASALLGWISPVGILGAAIYYQPTWVDGADDELFHAFVPSLLYLAPVPVTDDLTVTGFLSLDFMDRNYAEAWYSVETATAELEEFAAVAGVRDIQLLLQVEYRLTKHLAANVLAGAVYLLKDAADSPYTTSEQQVTAGLYLSYTF